ncbi:Uncharacterised protein [Candidatus Burarchaeum australiense]|nr:Uncharacterised protein [Candidatus Burarchaeum australiense]
MRYALPAAFIFSFLLLALAGCTATQPQATEPVVPTYEPPVIVPQVANITIELVRLPQDAVVEGSSFSVTWFVGSNLAKTATRTGIYYGEQSKADVYAIDERAYPGLTEPKSGDVPGVYDATITAGSKDIYLRAMAVVDGRTYWTDEVKVPVLAVPLNLSVRITGAPNDVNAYVPFEVNWSVDSNKPKQVSLMELRYGIQSAPVPDITSYPESILVLPEDGLVPGSFSANVPAQLFQGLVYFRVHLVVDGQDYWSDETIVRSVQIGFINAAN